MYLHHAKLGVDNIGRSRYHLEHKLVPIVPFYKDISPGGEQLEHRKLAYEL